MYAKVKNDVVLLYPYSMAELQAENPHTAFGSNEVPELYAKTKDAESGAKIVFVEHQSKPNFDGNKQTATLSTTPSLVGGKWVLTWQILDKTAQQLSYDAATSAYTQRANRDKLLSDSDWTQVADAPVDKAAWAIYRQQLRDITKQAGFPTTITWPQAPGSIGVVRV